MCAWASHARARVGFCDGGWGVGWDGGLAMMLDLLCWMPRRPQNVGEGCLLCVRIAMPARYPAAFKAPLLRACGCRTRCAHTRRACDSGVCASSAVLCISPTPASAEHVRGSCVAAPVMSAGLQAPRCAPCVGVGRRGVCCVRWCAGFGLSVVMVTSPHPSHRPWGKPPPVGCEKPRCVGVVVSAALQAVAVRSVRGVSDAEAHARPSVRAMA